MKDREWCEKIEAEINSLKERLWKFEGHRPISCIGKREIIELEITWPAAIIGGLHFNETTTPAVFELKDNGNYYSRDILFNSARDLDDGTGTDLLSLYLDSNSVKEAFRTALLSVGIEADKIKVFLPEKNQGIKKYNGVDWWYWLKPRSSGSSSIFTFVSGSGYSSIIGASAVGGCAPAFCVGDNRHE